MDGVRFSLPADIRGRHLLVLGGPKRRHLGRALHSLVPADGGQRGAAEGSTKLAVGRQLLNGHIHRFGTAAALALDRYRRWIGRGAFDGLLYLPVIIPDVTMAVMLLLWFTQLSVPLGRISITLAHIAFNISFVAIVVRARLATWILRLRTPGRSLRQPLAGFRA